MINKKPDEVKKYFRTVAKLLHPDKNCHPKAKEVFQKIHAAVE
jgi:DnaJ-class molecular chaperone